MRNAKPQRFYVTGKIFTRKEKFQGNIYLKPEESPEDRWFCIVNNVMSPYDLYEILSGFSFLVSKFSNLSIMVVTASWRLNKVSKAKLLREKVSPTRKSYFRH